MIEMTKIIGFDWDDGNRLKNEKHRVDSFETEQVFFNQPLIIASDEAHSRFEVRFHALGITNEGRTLHVTFTLRQDDTHIRVISARDMSRKERRIYEEKSD
jgi:uncharacterized DUF497 family protein